MYRVTSNDPSDFEEALQVVYLSEGHGNQKKRFKQRPPHHAGISIVIDLGQKRELLKLATSI